MTKVRTFKEHVFCMNANQAGVTQLPLGVVRNSKYMKSVIELLHIDDTGVWFEFCGVWERRRIVGIPHS